MKAKLLLSLALAILTAGSFAATPAQEKAFVDEYRKALESKDEKKLASFLYTEGSDPQMIEFFKMMMTMGADGKILSVELTTPNPEDVARFNKPMPGPDGKNYVMPLKPYKQLVVKTESKDANGSSSGSSSSPVAEKNGKLVIPVPVPAKK